jgi:hypothetical protein
LVSIALQKKKTKKKKRDEIERMKTEKERMRRAQFFRVSPTPSNRNIVRASKLLCRAKPSWPLLAIEAAAHVQSPTDATASTSSEPRPLQPARIFLTAVGVVISTTP